MAWKITQYVAKMSALENGPFSIVDDDGFLEILEPRYTLPSKHYFAEVAIPDLCIP